MIKHIAAGLYAAVCVLQLYAAAAGKKKLRTVTKCLLLPLLCVWYLLAAEKISLLPAAALLFGWLGDLLLLNKNKTFLAAGAFAFAGGHVCYLIAVILQYSPVFTPLVLLPAAVFAADTVFVGRSLRAQLREKWIFTGGVPLYFGVLSTLGLFCAAAFFSAPSVPSAHLFAGAVCFVASDTVLMFRRFGKLTSAKGVFYVMLTYLLAQTLLILGLLPG